MKHVQSARAANTCPKRHILPFDCPTNNCSVFPAIRTAHEREGFFRVFLRNNCHHLALVSHIERIEAQYGDMARALFYKLEEAPPEAKLTLAMLLDLDIYISEDTARYGDRYGVRFPCPFLTEYTEGLLRQEVRCNSDSFLDIYRDAPDEAVALAVLVAQLKAGRRPFAGTEKEEE